MKIRDWLKILAAEILLVPFVVFLFRTLPEKRVAAVIAGALFVGLGLWILVKVWRVGIKWRCFSFWGSLLHLGATSLPLLLTRLIHFGQDFTQVKIFGIPGPVFHYHSERVYVLLVLATMIDVAVGFVRSRQVKN